MNIPATNRKEVSPAVHNIYVEKFTRVLGKVRKERIRERERERM
jgi:hypothetical protein